MSEPTKDIRDLLSAFSEQYIFEPFQLTLEEMGLRELLFYPYTSRNTSIDFMKRLEVKVKELIEKEEDISLLIIHHENTNLGIRAIIRQRIGELINRVSMNNIPEWFIEMLRSPGSKIPEPFRIIFYQKARNLYNDLSWDLTPLE